MSIIEVSHITKEYRLGQLTSIKETLKGALARLRGQQPQQRERFKALDDVSFDIEAGEVVGIIGQNGAGKSTLLKILAGITTPTTGHIKVRGKIAPLIEVGAGLNPELTGRENIFLNGAILGIPKKIIRQKMDEIIAFAELEEFIDTPIKRYSSGMQVRLGFSIATSVDAQILIVDEVLGVGDLAFQRKCFDRLERLIRTEKRTVLLVSHNIRQVERLCTRTILLDGGKVLADANPADVCGLFYKRSNEKILTDRRKNLDSKAQIRTSGEMELLDVDVLNANGHPTNEIDSGSTLRVRVRFRLNRAFAKPEIIMGTHTTDFFYLTGASTASIVERPDYPEGLHEVEYIVRSFPLVPGNYCVRFDLFDCWKRRIFSGEALKSFIVVPREADLAEPPLRNLDLATAWRLDGKSYDSAVPSLPFVDSNI